MSRILNSPIFSVHPQIGNPIVRSDLHRLILPWLHSAFKINPGCQHDDQGISASPNNPLVIMWMTTRQVMTSPKPLDSKPLCCCIPRINRFYGEAIKQTNVGSYVRCPTPRKLQGPVDSGPVWAKAVSLGGCGGWWGRGLCGLYEYGGKGFTNIFFGPKAYQISVGMTMTTFWLSSNSLFVLY